jgi:hypothetical protein
MSADGRTDTPLADTLDVLDSTEAKAALNIPATEHRFDTRVAQVVTAASRLVDSVFGPVVTRSVTKTFFEPRGPLLLDVPPGSPTFAVTNLAVTEYTAGTATVLAAETATVATADDYRFRPATGELVRRSRWTDAAWGCQEVLVVYIGGRAASTAAVDEGMKEAAAAALIHLWQHRGPATGAGTAGGDGAPFGGVPFSTAQLRKKLRSMYPEECLPRGIG